MVRLAYVILVSLPFILYYMLKSAYIMQHVENYPMDFRYRMVQKMIRIMKKNGRIKTLVYGTENLPKEGGYVMYPNHQGKYDALGIIDAHDNPCTFVIDGKRSEIPFAKEVGELLEAHSLDKTNLRAQVKTILEIIDQVKAGRRFIIFPEGGYGEKIRSNDVHEFLAGTFKCSIKSRTPIVPVALIDSYKVFGINSLRRVKTEVHFLKPLVYEEYKKLNSAQIAELVKERIEQVIEDHKAFVKKEKREGFV